jgi:hypothetical protein
MCRWSISINVALYLAIGAAGKTLEDSGQCPARKAERRREVTTAAIWLKRMSES